MTQKQLKANTTLIVNTTGRVDVAPTQMKYEVQPSNVSMRWRLEILNHATLAKGLRGNENVSVEFSVDNGPTWREDCGKASSLFGKDGVLSGETSIAEGFDLNGVSITLKVSDSKDHRIVVRGKKSKPDAILDNIDLPKPKEPKPIHRSRETTDEAKSMMDIRNSPKAGGTWSVLLEGQEVPALLLSPRLPKKTFLAQESIVAVVLVGAVREILTAMFAYPETYSDETWFDTWKRFALSYTDLDEIDLTDQTFTPKQRVATVEAIVTSFDAKALSKVLFEMPDRDTEEE